MRRFVVFVALGVGFVLSLLALLGKLSPQGSADVCRSEACQAVQFSGFSELLGVPITAPAVILVGIAFLLYLLGRREAAPLVGLIFGGELYLTFVEFFYLKGWCPLCIAFASSLAVAAIALLWEDLKGVVVLGVMGFLGFHLLFFFPNAELLPGPVFDPKGKILEVFLRPNQEKVLLELCDLLSVRGVQVIPRYVSGGAAERQEALRAIARRCFLRPTGTAMRLAEGALRRNEREWRHLGGGTPLFVLKEGGRIKAVLEGDYRKVLDHLEELPPIFLSPGL